MINLEMQSTYLCNSGVSWLHRQPERWQHMAEGAAFFKALMQAPFRVI